MTTCYLGHVAQPILPYDMFDTERTAREAKRFSKMESIYHKGQDLAWKGHDILDELWDECGGHGVSAAHREPLARVLGILMWGELAAWKVAAQLSDELVPLEARMAAISQAHDEARHFYVMHEYVTRACGEVPTGLPSAAERLLRAVLEANTSPKKVLGMQLQLEPTALTIFHALREQNICPVLSKLLAYFEKDEARHVGLGVQLLPSMLENMPTLEGIAFTAFSFKVATFSIQSMTQMQGDLRALGVDPRRVAILGKSKQLLALEQLWASAPDTKSRVNEQIGFAFDAVVDAMWPAADRAPSVTGKVKRFAKVLKDGLERVDTVLDPTAPSHP